MIESLIKFAVSERRSKRLLSRYYVTKSGSFIEYKKRPLNFDGIKLDRHLEIEKKYKNNYIMNRRNSFRSLVHSNNKWDHSIYYKNNNFINNAGFVIKKNSINNYIEKANHNNITINNLNKLANLERRATIVNMVLNNSFCRRSFNTTSTTDSTTTTTAANITSSNTISTAPNNANNKARHEETQMPNITKDKKIANSNKENKTVKQLYLDKKQKEKFIKLYLLLSFILIPLGYTYMYCIQNKLTVNDLLKIFKNKLILLENTYNNILHELIDKYFPLSNEPLLPDFKDLNYPENLPTLVIDLNYVVAKLEYNRKTGWRVLKRPYADLFFKELSSFYEIVIWSDDNFPVAQEVISMWGVPVIGCLHRDQCTKKKRHYVKNLERLGRNLDRLVIVDHDAHAFMLQPENGILIKEFNGDVNDKELLSLVDLLKSFAISTMDIKQFLKKYGGGDYNIGKRYLQLKSDTEQKSNRIRSLGKIFHIDNKKNSKSVYFNS